MTRASDDATQLAIAAGLSVVCGTCSKWRKAVDQGLSKCLAVDDCGSPIVGDSFHEYEGPITDFLKLCFVCGDRPTKGIRVHGHVRLIGACDQHAKFVAEMAPQVPRRLPVLKPTIVTGDGQVQRAEDLLPARPTHKSLAQALLEMQKGTFKPDG